MAFLLRSGELSLSDVEYYLAYTTMIHQYYEVYEWDSILEFDYLYRERVCDHIFQWGFIPANMELGLLANPCRPRQGMADVGQGFRAAASAQPHWTTSPPKAKASGEECQLFKNFNGNCPYGNVCIFVHPALPKLTSIAPCGYQHLITLWGLGTATADRLPTQGDYPSWNTTWI